MINDLQVLFTRDLNKLKSEIELYKDESNIWRIEGGIKNSGGNLCLHLVGNLKTYIGNGLANLGYVRRRDLEFASKNIKRKDLLKLIDETIEVVSEGLSNLKSSQLETNFPIEIWDKPTGMVFTLIHLHGHLNYHLGQINYHRRLLEKEID